MAQSLLFLIEAAYLADGLEHFLFFHMLGMIIPTDELHHFSEG